MVKTQWFPDAHPWNLNKPAPPAPKRMTMSPVRKMLVDAFDGHPGGCTILHLSKAIGRSKETTDSMLRKLLAAGMVRKTVKKNPGQCECRNIWSLV